MLNREMPDGGNISGRLRRFGELVADDSPLYGMICRDLAENDTILEILAAAPYDQPAPNILLAAVQYLLLEGLGPELAAHYPSVTGTASSGSGDPVELFAAFCREERNRLTEIVSTRTVQTNEVRRCTALLPAFAWVAKQMQSPLAIIEVGASAGLNLAFDRYRYDYGDGVVGGPVDSKLLLSTELRTGTLPPIDPLPEVVWRRGIDLHPVDINDPAAVRWARALLWPEQLDRIRRFERAVDIARSKPPDLIEGDALELLPEVARSAPGDAALVVLHSFVLYQFSAEERELLTADLAQIAQTRDVHLIGMEMLTGDREPPPIECTRYSNRESERLVLGRANYHGAWLEWSG